jgi:hypothetical protein
VRRVVVPDADRDVTERAGGHELERVADDDLRRREPEAREVRVDLLERGVAEGEAVDADEALSLVPEHRRDEACPVEDADLDVRLVALEARRGEVQQREVVLAREVLHVLGDRLEAAVQGMLGAREVLEELWQLLEEAIGIHERRRGKPRPTGGS